ncbi:MAG: hypothetical protein M3P93_16060 [Actinomycetota bacterium]|nr:hypothetical protein [Actinomycetota bacterium]
MAWWTRPVGSGIVGAKNGAAGSSVDSSDAGATCPRTTRASSVPVLSMRQASLIRPG